MTMARLKFSPLLANKSVLHADERRMLVGKTVSPVRFEGVIPREMRIFVVVSVGNSVNL